MVQLHSHRCISSGFCVFITMILGSDGALTLSPNNKAVPLGTSRVNIMSCASDIGFGAINWNFLPVGGSSVLIAYNGLTVATGQNQSYAVEQSGSQQINLFILSATAARAGTYICSDVTAQQASAQLIVFNSGPDCTMMPNAPTELLYNQAVQMSCSISYTANTSYVAVNMSWSKGEPTTVVSSSTPQYTFSGTQTTATSNITQMPGYVSPFPCFNCTTSFKVTGNPPGSANNQPGYSKSIQITSPITVKYLKQANENSITGAKDGDKVYLGATVTCTVDGNPKPNYSWLDITKGNTTNTSSVQIWHNGEYKCTAWNTAGSTSASINVTTYTTTAAPTTSSISTSTVTSTSVVSTNPRGSDAAEPGGLAEGGKIGIGVGIGVGMIVIVGGIVSAILCRRYERNKSTNKDDNTANGKEEDSKRTHGDNSNIQHYEPLNVLADQATNDGPTYEQLAATTNVKVIEQGLSDKTIYENPGYKLNANEFSLTDYEGLQKRELSSDAYESIKPKH